MSQSTTKIAHSVSMNYEKKGGGIHFNENRKKKFKLFMARITLMLIIAVIEFNSLTKVVMKASYKLAGS